MVLWPFAAIFALLLSTVLGETSTSGLDVGKVAWFHVPKCGTSFINVIMTWACPGLEDDQEFVLGFKHNLELAEGLRCKQGFQFDLHSIVAHDPLLTEATIPMWLETRGGRRKPLKEQEPIRNVHFNLTGNSWDFIPHVLKNHSPNFVGMFRQPEMRIISGFHHPQHGKYGKGFNLMKYAQSVSGCTVRMLNGFDCYAEVETTYDMVETGIRRVQEDFAWVGLVEEWALSVCLFHAMFGGKCHRREFNNLRAFRKIQHGNPVKKLSVEHLQGWTDPLDGPVFNAVKARFDRHLKEYGVSLDTCQKHICAGTPDEIWESRHERYEL